MKKNGFIVFTVYNDATRIYLQDLDLADCFDEDDNIAFISFEEQNCGQNSDNADVVLLYDKTIDAGCARLLSEWVKNVANICCVFHKGMDTPEDTARILAQKEKMGEICGEKLCPVQLYEHSTCGRVYDRLVAAGHAVNCSDRPQYNDQLNGLALLFNGTGGLDEKLDLLHACLSPDETGRALQRLKSHPVVQIKLEKSKKTLYELLASIKTTPCFDQARLNAVSLLGKVLLQNE